MVNSLPERRLACLSPHVATIVDERSVTRHVETMPIFRSDGVTRRLASLVDLLVESRGHRAAWMRCRTGRRWSSTFVAVPAVLVDHS